MAFVREKFDDIDFMGRASESLSQFDEKALGILNRETMLVILTQRGTDYLYFKNLYSVETHSGHFEQAIFFQYGPFTWLYACIISRQSDYFYCEKK